MNKCKKNILMILLTAVIVGMLTIIPGFALDQSELSKIFLTRDEFSTWATSTSKEIETLEAAGQVQVQKIVEKEMEKRGIATQSNSSS